MDLATLGSANKLDKKIREFNEALNCFEWQHEKNQQPISTNPQIIIEFDGEDGREQIKLPMNLSDAFVGFMKSEIIKGRDAAKSEFDKL